MSEDAARLLERLATSALKGVIEGLKETADTYGGEVSLTLDEFIALLQAVVDDGVMPGPEGLREAITYPPYKRHLHSVKV
jgi:hypothetical protein